MEEKCEIKLELKNLGYTPRQSENLLVTECLPTRTVFPAKHGTEKVIIICLSHTVYQKNSKLISKMPRITRIIFGEVYRS